MQSIIEKYFVKTEGDYPNKFYPPASLMTIQEEEKKLNFEFPADFKKFFQFSNGYTGFVGKSYLILNKIEEIKDDVYNNQEFHPWAIQIGSSGGGEMYVLFKKENIYHYGLLPMIGEKEDLISLGNSFEEFIRHLYFNDFWRNKNR
jgi:hypothetical protein